MVRSCSFLPGKMLAAHGRARLGLWAMRSAHGIQIHVLAGAVVIRMRL
jgi:hypothetical protein